MIIYTSEKLLLEYLAYFNHKGNLLSITIILSVSLVESSRLQGILILVCLLTYLAVGIGEEEQGLSVNLPLLRFKGGVRIAKNNRFSIFSLKPIMASVLGFARKCLVISFCCRIFLNGF